MFGTLRFFLAVLVVMNHVPNNGFPFDIAVSAVILFYLVTGHLMGLKLTEYRERCSRPGCLFLVDRFLRIYPAYFAVLVITLLLTIWFGPSRSLMVSPDGPSVVGNFLLLPVGYFMFFPNFSLFIPPAFSLALEEQFYLVLPLLLLRWPRLVSVAVMAGLVLVGIAAGSSLVQHALTKWTGDYLIYRLLPGTFPIFFLGVFILRVDSTSRRWIAIILSGYAVLFAAAYFGDTIQQRQVMAVTIGVLAGYPIVAYLARCSRNRLDEIIGRGAYGMFLIHFTVIWVMQKFVYKDGVTNPLLFKVLIVLLSILGGFIINYLIERPMTRFRHHVVERFIARYPRLSA